MGTIFAIVLEVKSSSACSMRSRMADVGAGRSFGSTRARAAGPRPAIDERPVGQALELAVLGQGGDRVTRPACVAS